MSDPKTNGDHKQQAQEELKKEHAHLRRRSATVTGRYDAIHEEVQRVLDHFAKQKPARP